MFTIGVVFGVLAGIHIFLLLVRAFGLLAARKMLQWTENSTDPEIVAKREELQTKAGTLEKVNTTSLSIFALVFLAASILFFYFQ